MEASSATAIPEENASKGPRVRQPKPRKPNYNLIHKDPLPLQIVPMPLLIPHNPISLLHLVYVYFFPPAASCSHPTPLYKAAFCEATASVNVTDAVSIQGLWCRGFYGKGSLSRSEPTWLIREKRKLGLLDGHQALTAEEYTEKRRIERRDFKQERAKKEREKLEQILLEEGKIQPGDINREVKPDGSVAENNGEGGNAEAAVSGKPGFSSDAPSPNVLGPERLGQPGQNLPVSSRSVVDIEDLEHLQLTLEEAFFLSYGLGALRITHEGSDRQLSNSELLKLFRMQSYIPAVTAEKLQPDDPFLLNYVVYHHFRSLGWVVRCGVKFAVDYLLYNRGPAFTHAEFGVIILPAYSDIYWNNDTTRKAKERPEWHWLHCVNRVCSGVQKTLVLCYVEVPPPPTGCRDVGHLLGRYKVREVSLRRWLPGRNRD